MKIKDLIELPPVKTVIQLKDAHSKEEGVLQELLNSFVITAEVEFNLSSIFDALSKHLGTGAFLKGNYGSGKSHFLAVLSILLEHNWSWEIFLQRRYRPVKEKRFLVVKVPLVQYPSNRKLEEIILSSIEEELTQRVNSAVILANHTKLIADFNKYILPQHPEFLKEQTEDAWYISIKENSLSAAREIVKYLSTLESIPLRYHYDRSEAFEKISQYQKSLHYDGLVLLIDELSEFLKAKPGTSVFNEDVRYLQYLGEKAQSEPLWIIASLQESIEDIGYMEESLFNRIKDRYPKRLTLSSKHVEELIERRLIIKKEGAKDKIDQIYTELHQAFPHLVMNKERFFRVYPVHLATIRMLEGLSVLFSQHRGIVDYIHYQIKGDASRTIEGMMEEPDSTLLTPETIFDHFAYRIKETVEIAPYYNIAFTYFLQEIPDLFEKERDQNIALRLIKLLILTEISPTEKRHTVKELTDMLIQKVTDLEGSLNYDYLKEAILDRLLSEAAYIKSVPGKIPLETIYYLDLDANINQLITQYTKEIIKELQRKEQIYLDFLKLINTNYLPLAGLIETKQKRFIQWENTPHEGTVILRNLCYISLGEIESLHQALLTQETDFLLLIGFPNAVEEQEGYITRLLTYHTSNRFAPNIVVWLPLSLTPDDEEHCFTTYAHQILLQKIQRDDPHQITPILEKLLEKEMARLREIFTQRYFGGKIFNLLGDLPSLKNLGQPAFDHLLKTIFSPLLSKVYLKHTKIMPSTDYITQHIAETLWDKFITRERLTIKQAKEEGIQNNIESILLPLGLAKKTASHFLLNIEPTKNELITDYLVHLLPGKKIDIETLYWELRKSEWALCRHRFNLLTGSLIHTGYLTPYKDGRLVHFSSISKLYSFDVDELGEGKLLESAYIELLSLGNFIWQNISLSPFTLIVQRQVWDETLKFKEKTTDTLSTFARIYPRFSDYATFKHLPHEDVNAIVLSIEAFLDEIKTTCDSKSGLERVLMYLQKQDVCHTFTIFQNLVNFFTNYAQDYNRIYNYVHHPQLYIPSTDEFSHLLVVKEKVIAIFTDLMRVVFEGEFEKGLSEYGEFFTSFSQTYSQYHHEYYTHPYFSQINEFRSRLEYSLLEKLGRINLIGVEDDLIRIERMLQESAQKECLKKPLEELELKPICTCQYRLGLKTSFPDFSLIMGRIVKGIIEYLDTLKEPRYRSPLESHIRSLSELGRPEIEGLRKLLEIDTSNVERLIIQLRYLLTEGLISQVNQALEGRELIVKRDISTLIEDIGERKFQKVKLLKCFEDWVNQGENLSDDVYIAIASGSPKGVENSEGYRDSQDAIVEKGERFLSAFWAVCALAQHKGIGGVRESIFLRTAYQINLAHLDQIVQKGLVLKLRTESQGEIEIAERSMKERGEMELFLKELMLYSSSTTELLQIIANEEIFRSVSKEATCLFVNHVLSKDILPTFCVESKRDDWYHIQMTQTLAMLMEKIRGYSTEEDILFAYIHNVSPINFLIEKLANENFREGLLSVEQIKTLNQKVSRITKEYVREFGAKFVAHKHLSISDFYQEIFIPYRKKYPEAFSIIFILDGARWDTFDYLLPQLKQGLPDHNMVQLIALEALEPTVTKINRSALLGPLLEEGAGFYSYGEGSHKREEICELLSDQTSIKAINFNFIDDRLHSTSIDLPTFYEELNLEMKNNILPYFKHLPKQSLIFIISDHGFLYQPSKKESYTHGGSSPFEKILPCGIWV